MSCFLLFGEKKKKKQLPGHSGKLQCFPMDSKPSVQPVITDGWEVCAKAEQPVYQVQNRVFMQNQPGAF